MWLLYVDTVALSAMTLGVVLWLGVELRRIKCDASMRGSSLPGGGLMRNQRILNIVLMTALILAVPLVAMRFTDEVNWDLADFIVAGALLFGTGIAYEIVSKRMPSVGYRVAVGVALVTALMLVWVNLAVGLIGSEGEAINLLYLGVLAVAVIGAALTRFRPRGMAWAMLATAAALVGVGAIALITGAHELPGSSVLEIVLVSGVFAGLFGISASLFHQVSKRNPRLSG